MVTMSTTIWFRQLGGDDVLEIVEAGVPSPGPGEVTIANLAIGVNPVDWKIVAGTSPALAGFPDRPGVPGNESAGVVTAVGTDIEGLRVGDPVIYQGRGGGYCARATVPATALRLKPQGLPFEQAAVLPVAGATAMAAVNQVDVGPADLVLVHAASGGVGSAVSQIAISRGARVIGTASRANFDYLRTLGVEPVEYGPGLVEEVRARGTVTVAIDTVGGHGSVEATRVLVPDLLRTVTVVRDPVGMSAGIPFVRKPGGELEEVIALATAEQLVSEITSLPLTSAREAFAISRRGHVRGKLVLVP